MPRQSTGQYPDNWQIIAEVVKDRAGWECIRCGHPHDPVSGHTLTVHHFDLNKSNCEWWNLGALCQRCHLRIQSKVIIEQAYMFKHSEWFKPYVAGYYAHQQGLPTDEIWVRANQDDLIRLGLGAQLLGGDR